MNDLKFAATCVAIAALASCSESTSSQSQTNIDGVTVSVPPTLRANKQSELGRAIVTYTNPEGSDASPSEALPQQTALTIIRTHASGKNPTGSGLVSLLTQTQKGLVDSQFGAATQLTTAKGYLAARIDGEFRAGSHSASGSQTTHLRSHAVVVVPDGLVHVMLTRPRTPSPSTAERSAMNAMLQTTIDSIELAAKART